jgi:hypothetical protein
MLAAWTERGCGRRLSRSASAFLIVLRLVPRTQPRSGSRGGKASKDWTGIGAMNRWKSPSAALRAPSPPLGEKDGMRGFGPWKVSRLLGSVAAMIFAVTLPALAQTSPVVSGNSLEAVADTKFSVNRGFFEAPFTIAITNATPGATIYYSVDCSEPVPGKSFLYTNALAISNTTVLRARAFKEGWRPSNVDTHTYLFLGDVIYQAANGAPPPNFPSSWGANAVNYGMDSNVIAKYSLAEWREALTQIPSMSLVTEMKNLFDPATGIYANALLHGEAWERSGSIELLDPKNVTPGRFQENCGLRIRGGYSRNPQYVKHSFRVFFRGEYGAPKLRYPLFEEEGAGEFDTFDLRTSQNYSWAIESNYGLGRHETMVREVFCRETLGAMGQSYRRSRYYHLYLNGQYWGLYETDERPEASYGETYLGGKKEDYDVVKSANHVGAFTTEATDGNLLAFSNLWTMARAVAANPANSNYFRVLGRNADGTRNPTLPVLLDVDNLIDYMLGIFYSGDGDATLSLFLANNRANNWFGMRDRANAEKGFIFFNSDCEHTLGAIYSEVDRTGPFGGSNQGSFLYANPQWIHEDLMRNAEYRLRFADRVQRHFFNHGALTPEAGTNRFLRKAGQIDKAIRAYSARWGDAARSPAYGETDWKNMINEIVNNWFPSRTGVVLQQLRNDGLFPSLAAPVFGQLGGQVPAGFRLELAHSNSSGAILFATDGNDPRLASGAFSSSAQSYSQPVVINAPTVVRARVLSGTNWSALAEATFYPPQNFTKLLVTEIMYHPLDAGGVDGDEFEFLELKNAGTNALDLSGLNFTTGVSFAFTNGTRLAPGAFFVLVRNSASFSTNYPGAVFNGQYTGKLDNAGETVRLSDQLGKAIWSITYSDQAPWPAAADGTGRSLQRTNTAVDGGNPANWEAAIPTPGADLLGGGTPTNGLASLKIDAIAVGLGVTLTFGAISNQAYSVEFTDDLGSRSWLKLFDLPARASNRTEVVIDPGRFKQRFYRLTSLPR